MVQFCNMKFLSTLFVLCTFMLSSQAQEVKQLDIQFDQDVIALGEMTRGTVIDTAIHFTNIGLDTLQIDLVSGCECTTLDWPIKAIAPGDRARIDVRFDSTEKEESGEVEIDIIFKNIIEEIDAPYFRITSYTFELID